MNAAFRAVVRAGIVRGLRMMGVRRGYNGLISGDIIEMNAGSVSDIIQRGGTILYTALCKEFETDEGMNKASQICRDFGIGPCGHRRRRFLPGGQDLLQERHPGSASGTIDNESMLRL
jgi:6-phosphofructokinase 1